MKNWYIWILILLCSSCLSNPTTEKKQGSRSHIINIHDKITEIKIDSILLSGSTRAFIMNNYLIIADYKPEDKLIHIFDKATFKYLTSTTYTGQGPGEITIMGNIGINENRNEFYVSDHGQFKIFTYNMDSVIANPFYMPQVKLNIDKGIFPDRYQYLNDTLSIAVAIKPTGNSSFEQYTARLNLTTGKISPMPYEHPNIEKRRICVAASSQQKEYIECYQNRDLMTIGGLDGKLKWNIYGPEWNKDNHDRKYYFGGVLICGDKIVALYSGKNYYDKDYRPSKIILFKTNGDYIETLDTGYIINDFCYDKTKNRIIMALDGDMQYAYFDFSNIKQVDK